jgi:hypothetical protein
MTSVSEFAFTRTIHEIGELSWESLNETDCVNVAWAYYFFSVQFREHLEIARKLLPDDEKLLDLEHGECDTDNLSPWPGVAEPGERMHHDEFMRRTLALGTLPEAKRHSFIEQGERYLAATRAMDDQTRAMSIASYEDGGLEHTFTAMLRMPNYPNPVLGAFRHFLSEHIRFDSNPDEGHGALARHLNPDDRILPLWVLFHDLLVSFAPALSTKVAVAA